MKRIAWGLMVAMLLGASTWGHAEEEKPAAEKPKVAVPAQPAVAAAIRAVREAYKDSFSEAKVRSTRLEVAQHLIEASQGETEDSVKRYALLDMARTIYMDEFHVDGVLEVIGAVERSFTVDGLKLRSDALLALGRTAKEGDAKREVLKNLGGAIDNAVAADRYELAKPLADVNLTMSKALNDVAIESEASTRQSQVRECEQTFMIARRSAAVLKDKPTDPEASAVVGRYTCLFKGDWETGLPLLAAGSNEALKVLANKDLIAKSDADIVAAADGWYDFMGTQKGVAKEMVRRHTLTLYDKCVGGLSGLARSKVEGRQRSLQPARPGVIVIEAFLEGGCSLHVTRQGIYWNQQSSSRSKPGKCDNRNEPTYINGKEWMPQWGKPNESKGYDKSATVPIELGDYSIDMQVVGVGTKRGAKDVQLFYTPNSSTSDTGVSMYFSSYSTYSSNGGESPGNPYWYTIEVVPKSKIPPPPWKSIAGTYEAVFNDGGRQRTYTYKIDDQGRTEVFFSGNSYPERTGQVVKKGNQVMIDFSSHFMVFRQQVGGVMLDKYYKRDGGNLAPNAEYSGTFKRK